MRLLLACLTVVGLAGPAAACINDSELPSHEREFRSQYRGPAKPPAPPPQPTGPSNPSLLLAAGAALLSGAVALSLTGRRSRG
jgi:LPXTG-motif cell wall-anchored protein